MNVCESECRSVTAVLNQSFEKECRSDLFYFKIHFSTLNVLAVCVSHRERDPFECCYWLIRFVNSREMLLVVFRNGKNGIWNGCSNVRIVISLWHICNYYWLYCLFVYCSLVCYAGSLFHIISSLSLFHSIPPLIVCLLATCNEMFGEWSSSFVRLLSKVPNGMQPAEPSEQHRSPYYFCHKTDKIYIYMRLIKCIWLTQLVNAHGI